MFSYASGCEVLRGRRERERETEKRENKGWNIISYQVNQTFRRVSGETRNVKEG